MCPDPYSKPSNYVYKPDISYSQFNMSQCPYVTTAPGILKSTVCSAFS